MKKFQQIFAIILIIALLSLYAMTFVSALMASPSSQTFFKLSVVLTFTIPVFLYVFLMFAKLAKNANKEQLELLSKQNQGDEDDKDEDEA